MKKDQNTTVNGDNILKKDSLKRMWNILVVLTMVVFILCVIFIRDRATRDWAAIVCYAIVILLSLLYTVISLIKKRKPDWSIPISTVIILCFLIWGIINSPYK